MASKALAEKFAARVNADGAGDADDTASGGMGGDETADTSHITEPAVGAAVAAEATEVKPSTASKDAEAAVETPEQIDAKAKAARLALFEEKLAEKRAENAKKRAESRIKEERAAAKADREAAAKEKAKYDGLKVGSYKETLEALGRDPRKTFEEMQREAIEASTPEAQARREKEEAQKALDDRLTPLQQKIAELEARDKAWAEQAEQTRIATNFHATVAAPEFKELRIEYGDKLFEQAKYFIAHPEVVYEAAREHRVQLTDPTKGFTMHELLQVLSAAQTAYNTGVQARRAAQSPAEAQTGQPPTVNGTAPRRNAATAIGNDLASQRASVKVEEASLSPKERLRRRAAELTRRD